LRDGSDWLRASERGSDGRWTEDAFSFPEALFHSGSDILVPGEGPFSTFLRLFVDAGSGPE
jgi:hypothetical protein